MNIALIAHDMKKPLMVNFAIAYKNILKKCNIYATGATGQLVEEATGIKVNKFLPGPMGGDQQIGAMIAQDKMDLVIFLRDPLTAQPHEPDILALLRVCDVHSIPLATNLATAEVLIKGLDMGLLEWRNAVK
ncbi:methylglyoxal synthase [Thermoanaerobacterium sp. RBIITD]|uniref:methylglyoxal synthase n=1 Tax=Thermoanaerobacterium sp. RBIITD TaxID=1550240 RepID=UPI000BB96C79|nr:methylglyoxal synthase [Thermoanaerobacterium sp. RBIITD]SNX55152.1 methylglyoxal synthase [Thermoanaerobacterium sp. RBIITD]